MQVEQVIYRTQGVVRFLARSPGFVDDWLPWAERLGAGFGELPAGLACPPCVFAQPFGPRHVAVVQVADQAQPDGSSWLGFHLLVLPRRLYADLGGDPFFIAEQCPPPWEARGDLPAFDWTAGPAPQRTVAGLQKVMDVPYLATLLGGAQALVDGGRLVFERTEPATPLLRSLWALLPTSTRVALWPASFAFRNALGFHVVVLPRAGGAELEHYVTEDQAGDYPEGRYELTLQVAVEHDDQAEIDALFSRRSRTQMFRLAVTILLALIIFTLLMAKCELSDPPAAPPPAQKDGEKKGPAEKKGAENKAQGG